MCGGCKSINYCDATCQKRHWKLGHKSKCGPAKAQHDCFNIVAADSTTDGVRLPLVECILTLQPRSLQSEAIREYAGVSATDFFNLTAALMVALEPELVAESLKHLASFVRPMGGEIYLHILPVDFDSSCLHALLEAAPQLSYPLSVQDRKVSLFEFAMQLSAVNWSEDAAPKYLEVLRAVLASTKRLNPDNIWKFSDGPRDPLQGGIVTRGVRAMPVLQFAVCHASTSVRSAVVKALVDTGAYTLGDERCTARQRATPVLFDAVRFACAETVRQLLRAGVDVKAATDTGHTVLHLLSMFEAPDCAEKVQILLAAGADLESLNDHGITPLQMSVVAAGGSHSAFDALLAAGADPRSLRNGIVEGGASFPCLHIAVGTGDVGSVGRLLDTSRVPHGIIDVDARDSLYAHTALEMAAVLDDVRCIEALLAGGADRSLLHSFATPEAGTFLTCPLDAAIWAGSYRAYKALVAAGAQSHACKGEALLRVVRTRLAALDNQHNSVEAVIAKVKSFSCGRVSRTPQQVRTGAFKILEHLLR